MLQAQTVANFFLAFDQNLAIVPVLNKIDMSSADPIKVAEEMQQVPAMLPMNAFSFSIHLSSDRNLA